MNFSILPIFKNKEEQDFRKSHAFGEGKRLICSKYLLPLFFMMPPPSLGWVRLTGYSLDDKKLWETEYNSQIAARYFGSITHNNRLIYFFKCEEAINEMCIGTQYIEIRYSGPSGQGYLYTEAFTCTDIRDCMKLTWWDVEPFTTSTIGEQGPEIIPYGKGKNFRNFIYIPRPMLRPQYTYEEETYQRDGFIMPAKTIAKKTFRTSILASEEVADAMMMARLADFKILYDKETRYDIQDLEITPTWTDEPNVVNIQITFTTTDSVNKKVCKTLNPLQFADFNNDYNADYLTE